MIAYYLGNAASDKQIAIPPTRISGVDVADVQKQAANFTINGVKVGINPTNLYGEGFRPITPDILSSNAWLKQMTGQAATQQTQQIQQTTQPIAQPTTKKTTIPTPSDWDYVEDIKQMLKSNSINPTPEMVRAVQVNKLTSGDLRNFTKSVNQAYQTIGRNPTPEEMERQLFTSAGQLKSNFDKWTTNLQTWAQSKAGTERPTTPTTPVAGAPTTNPTNLPTFTSAATPAPTAINTLKAYDAIGNVVYVQPGYYYPGVSLTPPAAPGAGAIPGTPTPAQGAAPTAGATGTGLNNVYLGSVDPTTGKQISAQTIPGATQEEVNRNAFKLGINEKNLQTGGGATTAQTDLGKTIQDLVDAGASWTDIQKYIESQTAPVKTDEQLRTEAYAKYNIPVLEKTAFTIPTDTWEDAFKKGIASLGGDTIKLQMDALQGKITTANEAYTTALGDINENPWISEAGRVGKVQKLSDNYNSKYKNLNDQYTLLSNQYDRIATQAQNAATSIMTEIHRNQQLSQEELNYYTARATADIVIATKKQQTEEDQLLMKYFPAVATALAKATETKTTKTEVQKQLISWMGKYLDAGITMTDSLADAQRKIVKSPSWLKKIRATGGGKGTGVGVGEVSPDIETYAQDVLFGQITLNSVPDKIQAQVSRRVKELKTRPTDEWLRSKGYPTNVSFLPDSKVIKEWQKELREEIRKAKSVKLISGAGQHKIDAKLLQEKIADADDPLELYRQMIDDPDIPVEIRNLLKRPKY